MTATIHLTLVILLSIVWSNSQCRVTGFTWNCCPSFDSSMLSLRLLRTRSPARGVVRLATTAVHPTVTRTSSPSPIEAAIPLSNVEAQWERLTPDEQLVIHRQLEEIQKRDWKTLSLDEKRAGELLFLVSFRLYLIWPTFPT
jgi:Cytochrome c oxidase subunit IV